MSLNKNDLKQIKGLVREVAIETIKPMMKEVVLEAIEPMMAATQKEFDGIKGQFDKMGERFDKLEGNNTREHEEINLKLGEVTFRFELVALQKRVEVLEKKAGVARGRC